MNGVNDLLHDDVHERDCGRHGHERDGHERDGENPPLCAQY